MNETEMLGAFVVMAATVLGVVGTIQAWAKGKALKETRDQQVLEHLEKILEHNADILDKLEDVLDHPRETDFAINNSELINELRNLVREVRDL